MPTRSRDGRRIEVEAHGAIGPERDLQHTPSDILPLQADQGVLKLTLLPDPGPGGKLNTDLEGQDDKADEAAILAVIQGTVGCPAVGAGCDA